MYMCACIYLGSVEYKAFKAATVDGSTFRNAKAFTYAPAPAATAPQQ